MIHIGPKPEPAKISCYDDRGRDEKMTDKERFYLCLAEVLRELRDWERTGG